MPSIRQVMQCRLVRATSLPCSSVAAMQCHDDRGFYLRVTPIGLFSWRRPGKIAEWKWGSKKDQIVLEPTRIEHKP
jgi:hypothetical protein